MAPVLILTTAVTVSVGVLLAAAAGLGAAYGLLWAARTVKLDRVRTCVAAGSGGVLAALAVSELLIADVRDWWAPARSPRPS